MKSLRAILVAGLFLAASPLLGELEAGVPGLHAFVTSGDAHGLLRSDLFYSLAVDGVGLRDWIDDLVEGRSVTSRVCGVCRPAEAAER